MTTKKTKAPTQQFGVDEQLARLIWDGRMLPTHKPSLGAQHGRTMTGTKLPARIVAFLHTPTSVSERALRAAIRVATYDIEELTSPSAVIANMMPALAPAINDGVALRDLEVSQMHIRRMRDARLIEGFDMVPIDGVGRNGYRVTGGELVIPDGNGFTITCTQQTFGPEGLAAHLPDIAANLVRAGAMDASFTEQPKRHLAAVS